MLVSVPITNDSLQEGPQTFTVATIGAPASASVTIVDDDTPQPPPPSGYDEYYTYNAIGNLMSKAGLLYSYPASGSPRPHAVSSAGSQTFAYDANGNMTSAGGLLTSWDAENRPSSIARVSGSETYSYDADGERVKRVSGSTTTFYLAGLWEETSNGVTKSYYSFNGQIVAVRDSNGVTYLHTDHLGSISVATDATLQSTRQDFDPWGKRRGTSSIAQTKRNYTGQELDDTGLLYYHARYYDPNIGRFISADSIVPGMASGSGGGAATLGYDDHMALATLAVDFHEPGLVATLNNETAFIQAKGFWFQLGEHDRRQAKLPWGPLNPQALNRYSYVLNNPLRYVDPTGHWGFVAALIAGAFGAAGIAVAAPVVAAIAAALAVATVLWCFSDAGCRDWVAAQVNAGINNVEEFVDQFSSTAQEGQSNVLEARKDDIKFIDRLAKKYNLTKDQRRELHDEITKQGYTVEVVRGMALANSPFLSLF